MIENTAETMKEPANALAFLAAAMGPGGPSRAIEEQERAGQAQLVSSDRLPTGLSGGCADADFEDLGFAFGEPDSHDPLFRPATLPEGWKRAASGHEMWSHIVDQLGRRRVAVFYKAAHYDRRAHMHVVTVPGYVLDCVDAACEVIADDAWATPAAIVDAAKTSAAQYAKWEQQAREYGEDPREDEAKRKAFEALIVRFGAVTA